MARPTRPLIGINGDFVAATKVAGAMVRIHSGYYEAIVNAGGLPLVVPPMCKEVELDALLDRFDGIVLTGGLDMDPRKIGQPPHSAIVPMPERRDDSDRVLVRRVVERQMPLLAVGQGLLQLNLACGGSIYQHLPEDQPRAMPHRDTSGGPHRHIVLLEPNTRIDEIYGGGELRVNSDHHQAVREIGSGLRAGARAPDGVIESIEAVDPNWFCVGVMWHPESESASALDAQLFECFIQACLRQAHPLSMAA